MRSEILRELQSEYEQQRMANVREEERRRREAELRCSEIADLADERQAMIFRSLRGILDGTAAAHDLPARMEVINGRITRLLAEHGLPEDWLDPVYRCAQCKDTGYVGEPVREMCDCLRTAFFSRLYKRVGLTEAQEQSFEKFDPAVFPADAVIPETGTTQREHMELLKFACEKYACEYPGGKKQMLLLTGESGLGKTFLLHAMAKKLIDRGVNVLLISAYRFYDAARKAYFTGYGEELENIMDAEVLMIDDLGSEPIKENVTITQLFNLINERMTGGKGLVISTNLNEAEIRNRYSERIASRLTDKRYCGVLTFYGQDIRRT
ncbi:MAG: ATP-binding protein [Clostridia bacterium]|nr:ATP-binding protein [Clostridia bacterium]